MNQPIGQRYSQVYIKRGEPACDSDRMRLRVAGLFNKLSFREIQVDGESVASHLLTELGVKLTYSVYSYDYEHFFTESDIRDFLDSITIIWRLASHYPLPQHKPDAWRQGIDQVFREENVSYKLDEHAGVHLATDIEFEFNKASAISSLSTARYSAVIIEFQKAHAALDQVPADNKRAVCAVFEAAEILFRLIFPKAQRLGNTEIKKYLSPNVDSLNSSDSTAARSSQKFLNGFVEWVDSVHFYRHGQGTEEPTQPSLFYALALVSVGASYLRWLGEIDRLIQQNQQ